MTIALGAIALSVALFLCGAAHFAWEEWRKNEIL